MSGYVAAALDAAVEEFDLAADGWHDASDDRWGDWLRGTRANYRCLDCGRTGAQVARFGHGRGCDYSDDD